MDVTLTLTERCGHHEQARALLRDALAELGLTDMLEVKETLIRTDEDAVTTKCLGSPTIRVDGFDIEYQEREPDETSAGCRYFNSPAGWKPIPEKGMLLRALTRAKEREAGGTPPSITRGQHMVNERPDESDRTRPDAAPQESAPPRPEPTPDPAAAAPTPGAALRRFAQAMGVVAGARARDAGDRARRAAVAARPEVERLAREARERAEAMRPRVERAAKDAVNFAREHDDELRRAAKRGAQVYTWMATPSVLRPAVDALQAEFRGDRPAAASPPAQPAPEPPSTAEGDEPPAATEPPPAV